MLAGLVILFLGPAQSGGRSCPAAFKLLNGTGISPDSSSSWHQDTNTSSWQSCCKSQTPCPTPPLSVTSPDRLARSWKAMRCWLGHIERIPPRFRPYRAQCQRRVSAQNSIGSIVLRRLAPRLPVSRRWSCLVPLVVTNNRRGVHSAAQVHRLHLPPAGAPQRHQVLALGQAREGPQQ